MVVINSAELRNNMEKYLDIAKTQKVVIQRGETETFILSRDTLLSPDDDFHRAISMDEFRIGAKEHIQKLYEKEMK